MRVSGSAAICAVAASPHHQVWMPAELQESFRCVLPGVSPPMAAPPKAAQAMSGGSPLAGLPVSGSQMRGGGITAALWGLSGSLAGIFFHRHPAGFNEVIHGRKLWLSYDADVYNALEARDTFRTRAASASSSASSSAAQLIGENDDLRSSVRSVLYTSTAFGLCLLKQQNHSPCASLRSAPLARPLHCARIGLVRAAGAAAPPASRATAAVRCRARRRGVRPRWQHAPHDEPRADDVCGLPGSAAVVIRPV